MAICQQKTGKIAAGLFIFAQLLFLLPPAVFAASGTPTILSYQGRLTDESGNLLGGTGTTFYFKFSIWDNATVDSGSQLWPASTPATTTATVRQGVFNVDIGDTASGYPTSLDYNFNTNKNIYLQIEVSANNISSQTLSPRRRISSSAFSQVAGSVSGTGQSSFGTTTPFTNTILSIEATSTLAVPLFIKATLGQLANLFQIQNSTGSNLFVVNNNGNVGIGTTTPGTKLDVSDINSAAQLRLGQTGFPYGEFYSDSTGDIQISSNSGNGGNIRGNYENLWVCDGGSCGVESSPPDTKGNIIVENGLMLGNKFKFKLKVNVGATTTTIMTDSLGNEMLEFDENQ